jgi:hypothetical protein
LWYSFNGCECGGGAFRNLKGKDHEIFDLWFFSSNNFPGASN